MLGPSSTMIKKLHCSLDPSIAFTQHNTVEQKHFSKIKDTIPLSQKSGVMYKVPCSNRFGIYMDETSLLLKQRTLQHQCNVKNCSRIFLTKILFNSTIS